MRFVLLPVVAASALLATWSVTACDETDDRTCRDEVCIVTLADSGAADASSPPPSNDSSAPPADPFDAGTPPVPACKGLFELCSSTECCSPYGCTNGTCR